MGKKGKKAAKQTTAGGDGGDDGGGSKKKVGPGKARRERAATIRDLEARTAALAEKLDVELLEGVWTCSLRSRRGRTVRSVS